MGQDIQLTANDGHLIDAYRADPHGTPKGGVVVIQEIFGVNVHIRDVCDRYAEAGYTAIAPALFDRHERGIDLGYEADDISTGRILKEKAAEDYDKVMMDVEAARLAIAHAGKTGIVGYCWGGVVVWLAACRSTYAAASSYYGAGIVPLKDESARCPVMMHFGENDASIPLSDVEIIGNANPDVDIFTYDAGHGFNCDRRGSYDAEATSLATSRTLALFEKNVAA